MVIMITIYHFLLVWTLRACALETNSLCIWSQLANKEFYSILKAGRWLKIDKIVFLSLKPPIKVSSGFTNLEKKTLTLLKKQIISHFLKTLKSFLPPNAKLCSKSMKIWIYKLPCPFGAGWGGNKNIPQSNSYCKKKKKSCIMVLWSPCKSLKPIPSADKPALIF